MTRIDWDGISLFTLRKILQVTERGHSCEVHLKDGRIINIESEADRHLLLDGWVMAYRKRLGGV